MGFVNARRRPKVAELNNVAELTRFRIECGLKETRELVAVTGAVDSLSKEESKEAKGTEGKAKETEGPENTAVQEDGEERKEDTRQEDEKAGEKKERESGHVEIESSTNSSSNDPESQPASQDSVTPAIDTEKHEVDLTNSLIQDGVNVDGLSATATFQLVSFSPSSSQSDDSEDAEEDDEDEDEDERDDPESWEHSAYLGGSYAAWHDFSDGSEWHPDAWKNCDRYYYEIRPFC
jgi:ribosomal protein L12E/L44/L45/RPP1/RPP2